MADGRLGELDSRVAEAKRLGTIELPTDNAELRERRHLPGLVREHGLGLGL